MADYKRFVSYMYEYENGVKKKNVGYARVEIRNGECKLTIHMQLAGLLEGIFPTYLIHRPEDEMDLVYLGDCTVRNQVMDSRLSAKENNVMDTGYKFSDIGGILLFLNSGVFYATQWDDKAVVLEEVLHALNPKEKEEVLKSADADWNEEEESVSNEDNAEDAAYMTEESDRTVKKPEEMIAAARVEPLPKTQQSNSFGDMNRPVYMLPGRWNMKENAPSHYPDLSSNPWELVERYKRFEVNSEKAAEELSKETMAIGKKTASEDTISKTPEDMVQRDMVQRDMVQRDIVQKDMVQGDMVQKNMVQKNMMQKNFTSENIRREDNYEQNPLIAKIFAEHPRIYPFEDNEITRCVKIEPKDIVTLPSEIWILNNNSFLLHGYYCYHHLIFAEIAGRNGNRYILGVPGIYHNRERFMAKMFGFEYFKSIKKRELGQGDFGYWYLEVKI